jgi:hypothetical protein
MFKKNNKIQKFKSKFKCTEAEWLDCCREMVNLSIFQDQYMMKNFIQFSDDTYVKNEYTEISHDRNNLWNIRILDGRKFYEAAPYYYYCDTGLVCRGDRDAIRYLDRKTYPPCSWFIMAGVIDEKKIERFNFLNKLSLLFK